jgi:hypothetical protein
VQQEPSLGRLLSFERTAVHGRGLSGQLFAAVAVWVLPLMHGAQLCLRHGADNCDYFTEFVGLLLIAMLEDHL